MEETRLRDVDGAKSGPEPNSLGLFNSGRDPAFGRIGSAEKELGSAAGQVILRQEGRQRGPGGMHGESGMMAKWGGNCLGEETGARAKCTLGKLEVGLFMYCLPRGVVNALRGHLASSCSQCLAEHLTRRGHYLG